MKKLILSLVIASSVNAFAALEQELKSLELPQDSSLVSTKSDQLYAIQSRFSPLKNRHEIGFTGGKNLNQEWKLNHLILLLSKSYSLFLVHIL